MKRTLGLLASLVIGAAPALAQDTQGLAPAIDPGTQATGGRISFATVGSSALASAKEDDLLGPKKHAALVAVGACPEHVDATRDAVVLVHGIKSDFGDLRPLLAKLGGENAPYQLYALAYSDWKKRTSINGREFAEELRKIPAKRVTIIAHSLGGIVTRRALDELAAKGGLERFEKVTVLAIDTPWHGFGGPKDGAMMNFVAAFMPDGLEDMRARSGMFQGVKKSSDPAEKAGLFGVALPSNVAIHLVFAQQGDAAFDWTEKPLRELPEKIAAFFARGEEVRGEPQLENEWAALRSSANFACFEKHVRSLATIDAQHVRGALERHFPRYPGDHTGVLSSEELLRKVAEIVAAR